MTEEIIRGHLTVRPVEYKVFWKDTLVRVTARQLKVVHALAKDAGTPLTFRRVYDIFTGRPGIAAGSGEDGYTSNVRTLMLRVRHSFTFIDPEFNEIQTITNVGYLWRKQ